jgi:RNase P protein component
MLGKAEVQNNDSLWQYYHSEQYSGSDQQRKFRKAISRNIGRRRVRALRRERLHLNM